MAGGSALAILIFVVVVIGFARTSNFILTRSANFAALAGLRTLLLILLVGLLAALLLVLLTTFRFVLQLVFLARNTLRTILVICHVNFPFVWLV
jgi:glucan phosphoethanolaminetransferase (alkaline phosphatase superfamily)